ncbi:MULTISPECIES: AraC family transcriptional regulator [Rahnella]|uniref:AraC family transcriptional regulator n=1 Tax=Rahnella ecdela TaxID=2816250 RepID=A0ABS6LJ07_9GAMM|nr:MULTISPECIES: AraC family transcriptional regulator [Rahnella]MBU9846911.1 AraC family transcriptional regulator [Rahnella ecdela]
MQEQANYYHLAEFNGLEMLNARYREQCFSRHVHETFCILLIENGAQRFYRSGGEHCAPQGHIVLVNPDEVHTGQAGTDTGWAYRAIYPHPSLMQALSRDVLSINGEIPWFAQPVVYDPGLARQLQFTFDVLMQPGDKLFKESMLMSTMTWLVMRHCSSPVTPRPLSGAEAQVLRIRDLLNDCPEADFGLTELAEAAGLSTWHFLRQFKKVVGLSPHSWLIQARLRKAKACLLGGVPIGETALLAGFADQSHLNRHFKRAIGVTPGQFVKAHKIF